MVKSFYRKEDAVAFADDLRKHFPESCPLITTTIHRKYAVCYAHIVTDLSSEDTDPLMASGFLETQVNT